MQNIVINLKVDLSLCAFHFVLFLMRHKRKIHCKWTWITYCAVFACNSSVFFCVKCWLILGVLVGFFWVACEEAGDFATFGFVWYCVSKQLYLFNHYGILNFLLWQLNNIFMAVVKFLEKVFYNLQLCYVIVMSDSITVGKVCLCLWFSFYERLTLLEVDLDLMCGICNLLSLWNMLLYYLANEILDISISFQVHFFN